MAVLRSVAKTDTLERQRQVINSIALDLFNTTAGDSDLAAGNLKLGDGLKTTPSLAFSSQPALGFYKPLTSTIGFTSTIGDVAYFGTEVTTFTTTQVTQKSLVDSGVSISSGGSFYDAGDYTDIAFTGGFGSQGQASITVVAFTPSNINAGNGYGQGTFENVPLTSGSGSGAKANFIVQNLELTITNAGDLNSGTEGNYVPVSLTNVTTAGNPSGATCDIIVNADGQVDTITAVLEQGSGYTFGDVLTISGTGIPTGVEFTVASNPNTIADLTFAAGGTGYQPGDVLGIIGQHTESVTLVADSETVYTASNIDNIVAGSFVNGSNIENGTGVVNIDYDAGTFQLDQAPSGAGNSTLTFTPGYLVGEILENSISLSGSGFAYTVDQVGVVETVSITQGGSGYEPADELSVNPTDLTQPITFVVTNQSYQELRFNPAISSSTINVGDDIQGDVEYEVVEKVLNGSNIDYVVILLPEGASGFNGDEQDVFTVQAPATQFNIAPAADLVTYNRYMIDGVLAPSLTLYEGSIYRFDTTAVTEHPFNLSSIQDGLHTEITGVTSTITSGQFTITVNDATGILVGMTAEVSGGLGSLPAGVLVTEVDGLDVTFNAAVTGSGNAIITFAGIAYAGEEVTKEDTELFITPNADTPDTLYYYCEIHPGMSNNASITIDPNNPKTFGSGFVLDVNAITTTELFESNTQSGTTTITDLAAANALITAGTVTTLNSTDITAATSITTPLINGTDIGITATSVSATVDTFSIGDNVSVDSATGTIDSAALTSGSLTIDTYLGIDAARIFTTGNNDLQLEAADQRLIKCNGSTSFAVPSGTTLQRPQVSITPLGSIRYNTDTTQYEGYIGSNTWSSLGGVRDIDGNTYILAEETVGLNDNTLWFYNDGNNTLRITPTYMEFQEVNQIRSIIPGIPTYTEWLPNAAATVGEYIKYFNNLFVVTAAQDGSTAGVLGTLATPPLNTSGSTFDHGTVVLQFVQVAVQDIIFTESTGVRIGPNKDVPLRVSDELRFLDNVISTDGKDLTIQPAADKKVVVDALTSLVIPVGDNGDRGIPAQGSIRYNTEITQFEGYNGGSWSSLGGVRDVDGDTFINPETLPGEDEDTLFFNNGDSGNTLSVTPSAVQFGTINEITSASNILNVNVPKVITNDLTIDNVDSADGFYTDRVKLSSAKLNLDLGVEIGDQNISSLRINSVGLSQNVNYNDDSVAPVWRPTIKNTRDFIGLSHFEIESKTVTYDGTTTAPVGISLGIYDSTLHSGCELTIIARRTRIVNGSGDNGDATVAFDSEYINFVVFDDGLNIEYTEVSNVYTSGFPNGVFNNFSFVYNDPSAQLVNNRAAGEIRVEADWVPNVWQDDIEVMYIMKRFNKKSYGLYT